ncbi:concanavalin A-like lectin/glucanase domain-containing protein [Aspergillus avenaceus]|uniref:Concanavalin A-like lectin/glucanase domain-containing protein n=1 Tax=Aspergillus avenaceus TaxID=36643 RepID=A0A5N6U0T2_ASPAV|nr:concanavalin A-like lectin/glucanase domain-containing protein [Aspergillus avenaceus]
MTSIALALLTFILPTTPSPIPAPPNQPSLCDCYTISGPDPGHFTHYGFWDFRNIPLPTTNPPTILTNTTPFSQTPLAADWLPQTWDRASTKLGPIPISNVASNVFIAPNPDPERPALNPTYLLLRTTRQPTHASTAEVEFQRRNILHCSLRVKLRIMSEEIALAAPSSSYKSPDSERTRSRDKGMTPARRKPNINHVPKGACVGLFTYHSKTCESDIEILTSDPPHAVHYANQPDYDPVTDTSIPGSSMMVNLPEPWTSWTTHRLDWLQGTSNWYADGGLQAVKSYGVPDQPSMVVLNLWSDGGLWSGDLEVGQSVYLGVEWIEMAFNVSSAVEDPVNALTRTRHRPPTVDAMDSLGPLGRNLSTPITSTPNSPAKASCQRACYLNDFH